MKPEKTLPKISDDAKAVLEILESLQSTSLENLKNQSGLSNKKWDKAIKDLTANKLAVVEKTADGLTAKLV